MTNRITFAWVVEEETGLAGSGALAERLHPGLRLRGGHLRVVRLARRSAADGAHPAGTPARCCARWTTAASRRPKRWRRSGRWPPPGRFPTTVGVTSGGNDGSQFSRFGSIVVPISWPGRYSHSPVEVIDSRDLDALVNLIVMLVNEFPGRPCGTATSGPRSRRSGGRPRVTGVSIVIPTYDERDRSARPSASGGGRPSLGVDCRSSPSTTEAVTAPGRSMRSLQTQYRSSELVEHFPNRGYGGSLRAGFAGAAHDWIAFFCRATTVRPAGAPPVDRARSEADIVTGYRAHRRNALIRRLNAFGSTSRSTALQRLSRNMDSGPNCPATCSRRTHQGQRGQSARRGLLAAPPGISSSRTCR